MAKPQASYTAKLFYSYSHIDTQHRESMERCLSLLKRQGVLLDWSDRRILPGERISASVRTTMEDADIIVFLLSQDFVQSDECIKEWEYAQELLNTNPLLFRIPIILHPCPWRDFMGEDDVKALPDDGKPVAGFRDSHEAWQQVYEGIKAVVDKLRSTFTPKPSFIADMQRTDFISQDHIDLQDLYVFPTLMSLGTLKSTSGRPVDLVTTPDELLLRPYILIHGMDRSGKTALGRNLFLHLVDQSKPVLYLDLNQVNGLATEEIFRRHYNSQFSGDYTLWNHQSDKTLIMDNLSDRTGLVDFVSDAQAYFDRIIVTVSSSVFYSFFRDESRLAHFDDLHIEVLDHAQQENLLRKRLSLTVENSRLTDGYIDLVEDRINSIIIDNKIVPRYPFFILCILQTFEGYMPSNMSITSYGHCYYALIVASLVRAGISGRDSDINTSFNFAECLAYATFDHGSREANTPFAFPRFLTDYRETFIITDAVVNRLKNEDFGLIGADGKFRTPYMYYYFLGRYLSRNFDSQRGTIDDMCDNLHLTSNYLTLLFTIHHANDLTITDEILVRTMCVLEEVDVARLDREETLQFRDIALNLPKNILSDLSVGAERRQQRLGRNRMTLQTEEQEDPTQTSIDSESVEHAEGKEMQEVANAIYRVLKSNEIMGQILRNHYGNVTKKRIEEIVEIMGDGGLRLVNLVLKNESEVVEMVQYLKAKNPKHTTEQIRRALEWHSFCWTVINIEHIVKCVNVPEIRQSIESVVARMETPAFDIIGYFALLDSAEELTSRERDALVSLMRKHDDPFVRGILSLRTQHYMNTHRSPARIEQSVCSSLKVKYLPRPGRS